MADSMNKMQEVKEAWLKGLSSLVEMISMGFAGVVGQSRGEHENDFKNYGGEIRVKY